MPESALAGYLDQARAVFGARASTVAPAAALPDELARLRWFELPAACLAAGEPTRVGDEEAIAARP
jgi:hypothetical protein